MNWKIKARLQNSIAALPSGISYATYYWLQRHFGGLRKHNPLSRLVAARETWSRIQSLGIDPMGKVFFEIGTGRVPDVPVAYWLMGAKETITVDLNPYLKDELFRESIEFILTHEAEVRALFGDRLDQGRLRTLAHAHELKGTSTEAMLALCQTRYIAPADAANTDLEDGAIDFHTSYTVLEHIPVALLRAILLEGNRITKKSGAFVHRVDFSDHFSHSDQRISAINFLQYSDEEWDRLAGNRYMYMNRLRHDDYVALFLEAGHRMRLDQPETDDRSLALLRSGNFLLDQRFRDKATATLAIRGSWFVTTVG